jgi:Arc/MetJ-type ribon-helix-helix transcriptional regulator
MEMPMVGVRLPKEQAEQLRRLASEQQHQNQSLIIRQFIIEGLARLQEARAS